MRKQRLWGYSRFIALALVIAASCAGPAFATTSSSTHYEMNESEFGAGSTKQTCSSQYCSQTSIGDITSGGSSNTVNSAVFGPITPNEPMLEVIVDPGMSNLGVLTTEHTATKTTTVKIRNYLSSGYILQITGTPPKYANHTLATPTTPTAASPGTEQFGINAALNTSPSVGALPVQVPSSQFSFGVVNDDYKVPNLFKYVSEDVVAHSATSSGETDYTISMIVNISNNTPAGHYTGEFAAVVIPVY